MGGKCLYSYCFVGYCFQDLFKTVHSIFSLSISLKSKWCSHTVVLTWLQLGRIPILFYQRDQISI